MARSQTGTTHDLPEVTKIETTARVGECQRPAVVIWFANDSALRYVWDEEREEIREQTYLNGVVHDDVSIGGSQDDLAEYALESLSEYINSYRDNPDACRMDWTHIYEMLVSER